MELLPTDYRIIYNWDGFPHGAHPHPQTMEQFLESAFDPIAVEGSQVGALFWSVGEHQVRWEATGTLEQVGSYAQRTYKTATDLTHTENVLSMLARGEVRRGCCCCSGFAAVVATLRGGQSNSSLTV